jgi:hypothetical protein
VPERHAPALAGVVALVALALLASCGRDHGADGNGELTFERLADTTGLSSGPALVEAFDAYRLGGGALRVRGHFRFPDGTRLQVALKHPEGGSSLAAVQAVVQDGAFDSPPMFDAHGPFPVAKYRFEISAQFTPDWQPPNVLRATENGKALRGPGITRTRIGGAMFWMVEEITR